MGESARRVAVTGIGLVDPFGGNIDSFFANIMHGKSAVALYRHPASPDNLVQPAVRCLAFNSELEIGRLLTNTSDRYSQLGISAAFSAWDDAGLERHSPDNDDYGVSWGTGVGGTLTFEKGYSDFYVHDKRRVSPMTVALAMNNAAASNIAISLGLGGACQTYSVACASSAVSIGEAYRRIQSGENKIVLAGGSEAPLALSVMLAWNAMRVIASADEQNAYRACRPFQEGRTGLVLGEGAAALVLEDWDHAIARGVPIYCELAGYGQSCDHTSLVRPDADGQVKAIQAALREAKLSPNDVGYVNAHGTATFEGDPIEVAALRRIFGEDGGPAVSSTKSMHGHLLGAAGAIEAVITVLALSRQQIPPTAHLEKVSADCEGVQHVMGSGLENIPIQAAISNTFAFGGSNAVLAFQLPH